ncbi:NAD-dependent epimerase/dehydratase family protein [Roseisolibacter agri]|uniref:dTDP-glucose 4,6-dehydratase n=1 Tax=Roseisolibacter agri TaxID=2014610 RepID=A0AA37QBK1_9BACT|nr:NAD-dependent epimerase/dehydratase family protein [Roseisolibacter agri]GLC26701.1 dTDP-glucose 4,6-dehydratase [Roseisolibacter agri]
MKRLSREDRDYVLEGAFPHLARLRGGRLFVTGGTGFIGSWLVEAIAHANEHQNLACHLTLLVPEHELSSERVAGLAMLPGVRILPGDLVTLDASRASHAFDGVIHAAIHVDASTISARPIPTLESAVEGTRRTLEFARASGARRVLFVSSGAVYGPLPPAVACVSEDYRGGPDPFRAESVYAEGKRIGETMCAAYSRQYGIESVVARCFAFVGPRLPLDRHFAIGNFLRDALAGGPVVVTGDGTAVRSYMYAADLSIWLLAAFVAGGDGRVYNVGSSHDASLADVARVVASVAGRDVRVEVRGTPVPGAPVDRYVPSVQRAIAELGVSEGVPLQHAVERTLAWHRARS